MKKNRLAIIFACIVLASSLLVSADLNIDLSGYSVEELLELQEEIDKALYEKNELVSLPFGEYLVGRDIAAGRYTIKPHNNEDEDWNAAWKAIIYKTADSKGEYEKAENEYEAAYYNAYEREEKGETVEYPTQVNVADYTSLYQDVGSHDSLGITLEDGQLLVVKKVYDDKVDLTIEKAGSGLFMD